YGEGPFAFSPRLHDRSKPDGRPDGSPKGPGQLQWGRPYLQLNALDAGRAFRLHEGLRRGPDRKDDQVLRHRSVPGDQGYWQGQQGNRELTAVDDRRVYHIAFADENPRVGLGPGLFQPNDPNLRGRQDAPGRHLLPRTSPNRGAKP